MITIMQGDSYKIPVKLTLNNETLTADSIEDLEFYIGKIRKTLKENSVIYDESKQAYSVLIMQQDTFKLSGLLQIIIRVKFNGGDVIGKTIGQAKVVAGPSREVL